MQSTLQILTAAESANQFELWRALPSFSSIDNHPLSGAFSRKYYPLVFGGDRRDATFAVIKDGKPELIALCSVGADTVDYFGQPVAFFGDVTASEDPNSSVEKAFDHLAALAGLHRNISISDTAGEQATSVGTACYERGFLARRNFRGLCNLSVGEAGLRAALRRRYRPMVNWGRKNLRMSFVNASNPDHSAFEQYQAFHARIAGRRTRPQDTWDAMFGWIAGGNGELVLGYLGENLVAGTMVVDGRTTACYASGVYDREHFDKPLGHWPMHTAIVRSAGRGLKWFDIGDIPTEGTVNMKEYNIGQFKKGFVTEISAWTNWIRAGLVKHTDENARTA